MIGEMVAHYRILAEIGRGGMGVVYKAEDTRLHCFRALKFLTARVDPDSPEHGRLVNEARSLAALEHPNICPIQEIGDHDGQTYIVMSHLEGTTLKDRLEEGPLVPEDALEITRQVTAGLAAAHARGIVHRDVKPDNVMLLEEPAGTGGRMRAVLMDFGIAKNRESTLVTRTGTVMGTLAYMSPEQAAGGRVDAASDVWAVGVMLYEMLSGRRPFQGDFEPALLYSIAHTDPDPLVVEGWEVPDAVERMVGGCLAKDPSARYPDAVNLAENLELALEGSRVEGRRLGRSRWRLRASLAAGVVLALACALFVWPGFLAPSTARSTIAVMPFEDRSPTGEQELFAAGIVEDLEAGLSKIGSLDVVSRISAARASEKFETSREIGKALGVEALVHGSVQHSGNQVKVSVQMVSTDDDRVLWSNTYTRELREIFTLQREIALAVTTALEAELSPQEIEELSRERDIDPAAYEHLLRGRHLASKATAADLENAARHFRQALAIQPDFFEAEKALADMQILYQQMNGLPPSQGLKEQRRFLEMVIARAPDSADAFAARGAIAWHHDWDLEKAAEYFARSRALDPRGGSVGYAQFLNIIGHHKEALAEMKRAVRSDPLNPFLLANLGGRYFFAGDREAAIRTHRDLLEMEPGFWISLWLLGNMELADGNPQAAIPHLTEAAENSQMPAVVLPNLAQALVATGRRGEAEDILADLVAQSRERYVAPTYLACIQAALGHDDEAFAALEQGIRDKDWNLFWIRVFYDCESYLADDPRWPEIVGKIGLPEW